jgi:hypothetical protein
MGQIVHLAAFVDACRDPMLPALLMGDLNVDSYSDPDLYRFLMASLGSPEDLRPRVEGMNVERPDATSESDSGNISSFQPDHPARDHDDPKRFGPTAERLDYQLSFPGRLYVPGFGDRRVVVHQVKPGRDLSDHYGLELALATITQRLPEPVEHATVRVRLTAVRCLQSTSGPGDDEVRFELTAGGGTGTRSGVATPELEDMNAGVERAVELPALVVTGVRDALTVAASGKELDDLSADDSLGASVMTLEADELATLRGAPLRRVMPLLTGDGGEYALRVEISLED